MSVNIIIQVPEMTLEKYSEHTGLTKRTLDGMVHLGHLPTQKLGKRRMVNVAQRTLDCIEQGKHNG